MPQSRDTSSGASRLRLWPGVVFVILLWLGRFGLPLVAPDLTPYGVMAGMAGGLAVLVWWTFFSRASWAERLGVLALVIVTLLATPLVLHESIVTGAMGGLFYILVMPTLSLGLVAWAAIRGRLSQGPRRAVLVAALAISCGGWSLVRTGGFTGNFDNDLRWRWAQTSEERLLAQGDDTLAAPAEAAPIEISAPSVTPREPAASAVPAETLAPRVADEEPQHHVAARGPGPSRIDWPSFRGRDRDGVVRGMRIETNWAQSPPVAVWRRPVGPGWSSFAVSGDVFYTQEQRGDEELVSAYRLSTGEPVWRHRDPVRFWESNGGAGPRGTPTLGSGRVYAFGATGILNALDDASGRLIWSRNVASDTNTPVPMWGFSSSPLIVDDAVIVAAAGTLAAYDAHSGTPRWTGPRHEGEGYSSPHLMVIDAVTQIIQLSAAGATSVSPADGALLWEHTSALGGPIVQPATMGERDVLIPALVGMSAGALRRISLSRESGAWSATERWTTNGLKPYFNDYVVHKGHAYGFDGAILACIELETGTRKWKGGRYGNGQLVLLADQDLLVVTSEEGELALVSATTDGFRELARVPGIDGKTWNHPVLVGDILLVRNGEDMAAFRLALAR